MRPDCLSCPTRVVCLLDAMQCSALLDACVLRQSSSDPDADADADADAVESLPLTSPHQNHVSASSPPARAHPHATAVTTPTAAARRSVQGATRGLNGSAAPAATGSELRERRRRSVPAADDCAAERAPRPPLAVRLCLGYYRTRILVQYASLSELEAYKH